MVPVLLGPMTAASSHSYFPQLEELGRSRQDAEFALNEVKSAAESEIQVTCPQGPVLRVQAFRSRYAGYRRMCRFEKTAFIAHINALVSAPAFYRPQALRETIAQLRRQHSEEHDARLTAEEGIRRLEKEMEDMRASCKRVDLENRSLRWDQRPPGAEGAC